MLLFWIAVAIVIIVGESLKGSYDAYKFKASGKEAEWLNAIKIDNNKKYINRDRK